MVERERHCCSATHESDVERYEKSREEGVKEGRVSAGDADKSSLDSPCETRPLRGESTTLRAEKARKLRIVEGSMMGKWLGMTEAERRDDEFRMR